jgi:hypothetical protein
MEYRQPSLYKVTYRSGVRQRVASVVVKVPYGGVFGMTDTLTRMMTTGQIRWFRVEVAQTKDITPVRDRLERWLPALTGTSSITGVDWTA